jgi:hypothetical protein
MPIPDPSPTPLSLSKATGRSQWALPTLLVLPRFPTDRLSSTPVSAMGSLICDQVAHRSPNFYRNHPHLLQRLRRKGLLRRIPQLLPLELFRLLWLRRILRHSLLGIDCHLLEYVKMLANAELVLTRDIIPQLSVASPGPFRTPPSHRKVTLAPRDLPSTVSVSSHLSPEETSSL